MSEVSKEIALQALEAAEAGTATREIVQQSACYVFGGGQVRSYNDETAVVLPSPLNGVEGAVHAKPLLELLRKLPDEMLEFEVKDGELRVSGVKKDGSTVKGWRRAGVRMEAEVTLPEIRPEDQPVKWKKLPEGFCEAVGLVQTCVSTDQSNFARTCVHLTPEWIEACSEFQVCRYRVELPIKTPALVRQASIRHVATSEATHVCETSSWLHFKNEVKKLVLSCRRYVDSVDGPDGFPDIGPILKTKGTTEMTLPKNLDGAIDIAQDCAKDGDGATVLIMVSLRPGRLRLRGQGAFAWFEEERTLKGYQGERLDFLIGPALLTELCKKHTTCRLAPGRLLVKSGGLSYAACLINPAAPSSEEEEAPQEDGEEETARTEEDYDGEELD
jgi:hypothetical protein